MIADRTVSVRTAVAAHLCGLIMGMATIIGMVAPIVQLMRAMLP